MNSLRLCCALVALAAGAFAQNASESQKTSTPDRAAAYYHYSLGHLYADLASNYGNRGSEYFNKAIENFRLAMKDDPSATFIGEELSDLYIQSGRLREAVSDAEEALKQNPNDLNARRVLARIYTRLIGDRQDRLDENMVKKAIEQYQKITEQDPKDTDSWLMLGRLDAAMHNSVEAEKAYKKAIELDPDNEDALTGLAMVYSSLGNAKDAADLLRRASEKNPNPRSLAALAGAYEEMKDYALAAETLRRAVEQSDGNVDLKRSYANDLVRSDQLDAALKVYQELAAADPKNADSELRISQIYRQKHDYVNARAAENKAKEADPTNIEVRYNEVSILESEGKLPDAISTLKEIVESTSHGGSEPAQKAIRAELLEHLAFLYRENEQWAPAIQTYREIVDLDPDTGGRAEAQIVDTYRSAKELSKAQQEADAAIRKYPDDRAVKAMHASILADTGKADQAIAETKTLFNGKDDRETWLSLAQIYEKTKNWTEMGKAIDEAEKLAKSKEDRANIYFMRGAMFERMKNYDEAEAQFRKVLEIDPENSSTLNYYGYMLADRNVRLDEAHTMIKKALDLEPNNGAFLDSMGWVYFRQNNMQEAEANLRRAIQYMSTDPTVHDHLGDVYFHEGKIREAIGQWQASLKNYESSLPSDVDQTDVAKVQKKLENAKVRLARETGAKE